MMLSIILPNKNEPRVIEFGQKIRDCFPTAQIIISDDPSGKGKGWALRNGLKKATGNIIAFMDADGDINPEELFKLLPHLATHNIVVGKKELPKSFKRKVVTFLSRCFIRILFGLMCDTQTGLKVFDYKPEFNTDSWACDIEILYKAKRDGKTIKEVPIHATVSDSKTLKDIWITLIDSLKIRFSAS
jgi:glycosyltransferase involved in cell wall biosynthesis